MRFISFRKVIQKPIFGALEIRPSESNRSVEGLFSHMLKQSRGKQLCFYETLKLFSLDGLPTTSATMTWQKFPPQNPTVTLNVFPFACQGYIRACAFRLQAANTALTPPTSYSLTVFFPLWERNSSLANTILRIALPYECGKEIATLKDTQNILHAHHASLGLGIKALAHQNVSICVDRMT